MDDKYKLAMVYGAVAMAATIAAPMLMPWPDTALHVAGLLLYGMACCAFSDALTALRSKPAAGQEVQDG
jgi:hypothetical protein